MTIPQDNLMRQLFTGGEVKQILSAMDSYAGHMEQRATVNDVEDNVCADCGHPRAFHMTRDMVEMHCDFECSNKDNEGNPFDYQCGCEKFAETNELWPEGRDE